MKLIIFLCLTSLVFAQTVLNKNTCNACTQLKSQNDCTSGKTVLGCEWIASTDKTATTAGKCQQKATVTFQEYCATLTTGCALKNGCAYVDSKCTHFTGCSAFTKTTTAECQAISYECVSDGTACIVASLCTDYKSQTICETTPSISGILKCKWDTTTGACRDYVCSEADSTLTTDKLCGDWLSGCLTRGKGCWTSPLPVCASYTGDATTCGTYIGFDGNCELAAGATNCMAKICTNAQPTTATDADCIAYQKGCISTGKGCILATVLPQCSTYSGDSSSCVGYLGSDGVCEGDAGGSVCRSRKCENAPTTYSNDTDCGKYKTGCRTTGKGCIATLGACSSYQGTSITCTGYVGTDGYCKGTSTTTSGNCTPKLCEEAPATTTTEAACIVYQLGCKSTGQGCVKGLSSCTSYTGDITSCASRIGSEGNCTWASGTNCIARTCVGALSTVNTNINCSKWFSNCVTNGAGCVSPTTCDSTIKDVSCSGTTNCAWQSICTSNSGCSAFTTVAICTANKGRYFDYTKYTYKADGTTVDTSTSIYKFVSCAWRTGSCVKMECSDLTGTYYATDNNCSSTLAGCISNKKDGCITPYDCSKLVGTIDICKGFAAYCTNVADAITTTPCVSRKCSDNTDATDTSACNSWLPGCITNGKGCSDYNTVCTSFVGTQATCNNLFGYSSGLITNFVTNQCYNVESATATTACTIKSCGQATGKASDNDCSAFLTGCVYNGKDSCVVFSSAICSDFYNGSDATYCDKVSIKNQSAKYCFGTGNNGTCKTRVCSDNSTATDATTCDTFKTGCVLKSANGCDDPNNILCSSQSGTITTCPNFYGNVSAVKVKCTKADSCLDRACADITAPSGASDCTNYKSTCRFFKSGSACIDANACGSYNVPDTTATDAVKFAYCTGITNTVGKSCGFTKAANLCSDRTCDQFLSTYTILTCLTYYVKDVTTGSAVCKLASPTCYTPVSTCAYAIDSTTYTDDPKRTTYCQLFTNDTGVQCTFKTGALVCSLQDACEKVISATSAKVCNDVVGNTNICQKGTNGTGCTTTVATTCSSYTLPTGTLSDAQKLAFCQSLKVIDNLAKLALGTGVYKSCIWKTGESTCNIISACSDIPSAVSQADCTAQMSGCYYYSGKCIASAANCPTTFGTLTVSQKAEFCMANFETTTNFYCQLKDDGTTCIAGASADCILTVPSGSWSGVAITQAAYCQDHSTQDKLIHCIADGVDATKCKAGTCEDVASPTKQGDCDKYVLGCKYFNNKCNTLGSGVAAAGTCALVAKVPFGANIVAASSADKLAYCQSFNDAGKTLYCTYDSLAAVAPVVCMDATACNLYATPVSGQLAFCNSKVDTSGDKCTWTSGAACRDSDCYDISSPLSQVDCDLGSQGLKCVYYKGTCYNSATACSVIPVVGSTAAEKKAYCEALTANALKCRYVAGLTCTPVGTCASYDVTSISAANDKLTACNTLTDDAVSPVPCTFVQKGSVVLCAKSDACSTYAVDANSESTQCPLVKSSLGFPCKGGVAGSASCIPLTCEDITTGNADCTNNATGCLYYSSACYTKKACASYTFSASINTDPLKTAWCTGVTDTSGNLCKWDGAKCADRTCADVKLYTDNDCKTYLKTCKTDGIKCVASSTACNTLSGDSNFCNYISDTTFLDKCKVTTPATTIAGACTARTCYDNVNSTSDSDCNTHMSGCVTRGVGCIPNTATCDQYRGTKTTCEGFKQYISTDVNGVITYKYCSGDAANTATSACKNRVCSDNTTATDDTTCSGYLTGCVTNGGGCIEFTASCTSYKGTVSQCAKFMGSSGQDYCFATATDAITVVACRKKLCTDIGGANDKDCYNGMKPLKNAAGKDIFTFCVYDGGNCTDNNKSCSQFKGDVDTCATYTAYVDGPCKATTIGITKGICAKRVCTEAPNTLTTDADCLLYHSGCYTTGYGCTSNQLCSNLTNQASCSSRVECTWTNLCKTAITTCSTFSNTSQSQCMNTKVNGYYCAWSETGNLCRNQTCADQPATIKDHATCQAFSVAQTSTNCTTSGAGCITIGLCSTYTVQSVCLAASSSRDGVGRCGWENNGCRARACGDKQATSDTECDTFLSGCKTNGTTCVAANSCTDFTGNQAYCQTSKKGPCLYIGQICYDYTQCEDAPGKSHQTCQTFSPQCTTNGTNCVTITSCAATNLKVSCQVGTDGQCGWLPAGGSNSTEKCMKFGQCTDAVATTNEACSAYGQSCVTDGAGCIAVSTCSAYKTQISCANYGTDGLCFWNTTTSSCKLKDCGDATANNTTNDGCSQFSVASGSCTTDGTKCIPLSTCSSYVEAGCFSGTDGVCTFALAVGVTTGTTKTCRLKACEDIKDGISNGVCVGISPKKCVSNGTICITKAACTSYTTKTACSGGGVDSAGNNVVCAFTVTDPTKPTIGTCKQFSQCTDANSDQTACQTKTGICIWNGATTGTSCKAFACDTITTGTSCQPVPSFDGLSQTVCNLVNGKCAAADPGTITDANCYAKSAYTYSWNTATSKCENCVAGSTTPTNNTTNTNSTNTTTNDTTTTYGYLLGAMTLGLLGFMA